MTTSLNHWVLQETVLPPAFGKDLEINETFITKQL